MKNDLGKEALSLFRQQIAQLIEKLKGYSMRAGYPDLIFRGVPAQVYRTCGKATCRCMTEGKKHGPYKVIQVWDKQRSRQVTLKKAEGHYYEKALRYQEQQGNRKRVVETQKQILEAIDKMLEKRTICQKE